MDARVCPNGKGSLPPDDQSDRLHPYKIIHMANGKSSTWPMCGEGDCCIMAADQAAAEVLKLPLDKTKELGYNLA